MKDDEMNTIKEEFKRHLQTSFIRGLTVGQKAIATVILNFIENNELDKVKNFCERTVGMSMEDLTDLRKTFEEIFQVAEGEAVQKVAEAINAEPTGEEQDEDIEGSTGSEG